MSERRTAGMSATIGSDEIARLTTFGNDIEVTEEQVSGSGDTVGDPPIVKERYIPVSVGETANCGGVSLIAEGGEAAVKAAARTGDIVTLEFRHEDGSGTDYEGFFTNYSQTGELPNVFRFTAQFRVNDTTSVPAGS